MQTLRLVFKSGHVEKFTAESFEVSADLVNGTWNMTFTGWKGRGLPMFDKREVVAVTIDDDGGHHKTDAAASRNDS